MAEELNKFKILIHNREKKGEEKWEWFRNFIPDKNGDPIKYDGNPYYHNGTWFTEFPKKALKNLEKILSKKSKLYYCTIGLNQVTNINFKMDKTSKPVEMPLEPFRGSEKDWG